MGEEKKIRLEDKNGTSTISYTDDGGYLPINPSEHYAIVSDMKKKRNYRKNVLTDNIGPGSQGFAGIAVLASIIAIAGFITIFLTFKY